ncbi:hypothetical protein fugu_018945 [Takifugu bimaculatus]|uniref:Alpha-carbonic anhydrase domain-containing protein n=1 Tax=Takifugu bimaculatus TaxID=433685 RepID=A0A4Z2BHY7_9TELE|nr:hypothetical protein fugu_018945 [Takifugu bimaculatus]
MLVPSTSSDPYAWGDLVPACHPLLEVRHSPINLGGQVSRNRSLDSLHLEGFEDIQAGHWTLQNDGHSGKRRSGPLNTCGFWMHIVNMKGVYPNVTAALGDPTGLAVLGVFIDVVYADNVHFGHISRKLSSVAYKGQSTKIKPFALLDLLPRHNMSQYYRYYGSLTTPPCSQAVVWTLYEVPVYISWSQVGLLRQHPSGRNPRRSLMECRFPQLAQFTSQIFSDGGGRRAGHASAEQLPTRPPHLQPRRVHVQGRQTSPGVVLSPAQVGRSKAAASRGCARRVRLQVLTGSIICCF